jgi:hypothetical protein
MHDFRPRYVNGLWNLEDTEDTFTDPVRFPDVAKFVTKAIDLPTWPTELRMCGERVTVHNLTILVQRVKSTHSPPRYSTALH